MYHNKNATPIIKCNLNTITVNLKSNQFESIMEAEPLHICQLFKIDLKSCASITGFKRAKKVNMVIKHFRSTDNCKKYSITITNTMAQK